MRKGPGIEFIERVKGNFNFLLYIPLYCFELFLKQVFIFNLKTIKLYMLVKKFPPRVVRYNESRVYEIAF